MPAPSVTTERLSPCLPRSTGERPAASPPPGALVMQPSTARSSRSSPIIRSYAWSARVWTCSLTPAAAHSFSRRRIVASEQSELAIRSYPEPCTSAASTCSNTTRSGIRGRWHPSGWVGETTGRSGSSAENWSHSGSNRQTGRTGTDSSHDGDGLHLYCRGTRACLLLLLSPLPIVGRSNDARVVGLHPNCSLGAAGYGRGACSHGLRTPGLSPRAAGY